MVRVCRFHQEAMLSAIGSIFIADHGRLSVLTQIASLETTRSGRVFGCYCCSFIAEKFVDKSQRITHERTHPNDFDYAFLALKIIRIVGLCESKQLSLFDA